MGGPLENEHGQMIYFPETERFPGMPVTGPDRRFMSMIGYLGGKYKICGETAPILRIQNAAFRALS